VFITINTCAPNVDVSNFIKQTLMDINSQTDLNIIIADDFNIPLSPIDSSSPQKKSTRKL
jgi:hypothetical protein